MGRDKKIGRPGRLYERLDALKNAKASAPGLRVYLSYRHGDSDQFVDQIDARITKRFGSGSVVRDMGSAESRLGPVASIDAAVRSVTVMLVVIGPRWAKVVVGDGLPGMSDPIALEIQGATKWKCLVVPVLVDAAVLPDSSGLWDGVAAGRLRKPIVVSTGRRSPRLHRLLVMLARSRPLRRRLADVGRRARAIGFQLMRPRALLPIGAVVFVIFLLLPSIDTDAALLRGYLPVAIRPDCQVVNGSQYLPLTIHTMASARCVVPADVRSHSPGAPEVVEYALIYDLSGLETSFTRYLAHDAGHLVGSYRNATLSGRWGEGVLPGGENFVVFTVQSHFLVAVAVGRGDVAKWFAHGATPSRTPTTPRRGCPVPEKRHSCDARRQMQDDGAVRIVSLLPSATEIVFELGLGELLHGVSFECDYPEAARSVPVVSGTALPTDGSLTAEQIDAEVSSRIAAGESLYTLDDAQIRAIDPDLILAQDLCRVCAVPSGAVEEALDVIGCHAQVVSLDPGSLDEVIGCVGIVGAATGTSELAEQLMAELRSRVDAVCQRVRGLLRPRVLILEWPDPPFNAGHWVPDMVEAAGGVPVLAAAGAPSRRLTWDEIAAEVVDVTLFAPCGFDLDGAMAQAPALFGRPEIAGLGPIYAVDANAYFSRPGPRVVDGVELLETLLHPATSAGTPAGARLLFS